MHILVLLVDLLGVGFRGETSETFLEDVDSERFVACNDNIDSQVEFMAVDQKRIGDVL